MAAKLSHAGVQTDRHDTVNPLNTELNPICHLLALLGAHHIFHVSGLKVNIRFSQFCDRAYKQSSALCNITRIITVTINRFLLLDITPSLSRPVLFQKVYRVADYHSNSAFQILTAAVN